MKNHFLSFSSFALFQRLTDANHRNQIQLLALRARGELEAARDAFAEAVRILPSDPGARELLDDTEAALDIARQLAGPTAGRVELAPQLSPEEQARLEAQLRDARAERARLAASLEILAGVAEKAGRDPGETARALTQLALDGVSGHPGGQDNLVLAVTRV